MNLTRFKISSLLSGQLQASSLQPYEIMGHYVHFLLWCWGVPVSGTKPKWSLNNVGHVHRRLCSLSSCLSYLCSVWLSNWQTPSFQLHHIHCTTYTALYTLHQGCSVWGLVKCSGLRTFTHFNKPYKCRSLAIKSWSNLCPFSKS